FTSGHADSEELVSVAAPVCRRYASRLVEPAAVDDVVQESLIELLDTVDRLRRPSAGRTWLWLIVRKQAERHRRRLRLPLPLDLVAEFPALGEGPESILLRTDQDLMVRRALRAAPDPDRRLLVLRYAADWTDAELADLFDVSPGAIRKRLYDARRRLRPALQHLLTPIPEETPVDQPSPVEFGTTVHPNDIDVQPALPLRRGPADLLPTGLRAIDALVPIRRGGTVDFLGPVGTGHLVLICEIARNLSNDTPVAVIAAASTAHHADGTRIRLQRLIDPDGIPDLTLVVDATEDPATAVRAAGNHAASLANDGTTVLFCVDRVTTDHLDPMLLSGLAGVTHAGSVTVIRVAPNARDAEPAQAWPLDCTISLSLERMSLGILPAVDVLASRSALIEHGELGADAIRTATAARTVLAAASRLDRLLAQPLHVAEAYTGTPGQTITATQARSDLQAVIANI
ncbi:MAG: sigma-70 family RNA polymerase sigma factor, partial [Acidimicrobiaceae bacterium]|nr:sigma-70 family RNA polymerase sigma factor [Acidimicrobiaceae bacterium]